MNEKIPFKLICAIVAAGLMSFSGVVSETAMNITFPTLMNEFGIGTSTVQWLTTGYLLVLALIIPLSSFLKKSFTERTLFLTALGLFFIGSLCCTFANSFSILLLGRLFQGAGTGVALPLMFNIILQYAPKSRLGLLMGVASLITAMAPAVGPVLGGVLIDAYGWRSVFVSLFPLLILSFVLGITSIRGDTKTEKASFHFVDFILLAICFTCFIFATEKASEYGWLSGVVLGLLIASVLLFALFAYRANRQAEPLFKLGVFGNKAFSLSVIFVLAIQFCVLSLGYLVPNYAQLVSGSSATIAGLLLLPGCVLGAIIAPFSGVALDRFGAAKPIISGGVVLLIGLALFALFSNALTTALFMIFYSIYAVGQGFAIGNTMTYGLASLPKEQSADGNAVLNTLQQLAGAVGTSIAATLVASGQKQLPDNLAQSTMLGSQQAFYLILVLAVIGLVAVIGALREALKARKN